ncbi:MAG: rod shape-determining protein RodA [Candidatus Aureabacteria bacterium]|nr:rod shape-determining protein RodA [Candidatus Auribacterota bacterium]
MKVQKKEFLFGIFLTAIILSIIGCIVIYSAKSSESFIRSYAFKQCIVMFLGIFVSVFIFFLSYRFISFFTWIAYIGNVMLLIAVLMMGVVRMGAQRWLVIGGFTIQPSELCKITVILALAKYFSWDFDNRKSIRYFIFSFLIAGVPMLLILKQPDLGTAMIIIPVLFSMLFFIGANYYYLFGTIGLGLLSAPLLWSRLADYQKSRLLTFINPNADPTGTGYTLLQSKVAIGSGGLYGKGWFHGTQTQLGFLPEKHTDFIFSVLGEEWGFIGALVVMFIYLVLIYYCLAVADHSKNVFGKVASVGLAVMLFTHIFINIAMTLGLMPITGLPLPFLSYGGSSLMTNFIVIGLLLNTYKQRHWF